MSLFFTSDISQLDLWLLSLTPFFRSLVFEPYSKLNEAVHILNLLFKEEWNNDGMKNLLKVQIALRRQVKYYLV